MRKLCHQNSILNILYISHKVNIQWREKQQLVKAVLQFEGKNLFLIPYFLMMFKNTFSITEGDLISLKEPTLQNTWFIWSPFLCFNFKNLKEANSVSFISKFSKIKEAWRGSLGGTNSAKQLNYLPPAPVFQLQTFEGHKLFVIHLISIYSTWCTSACLSF